MRRRIAGPGFTTGNITEVLLNRIDFNEAFNYHVKDFYNDNPKLERVNFDPNNFSFFSYGSSNSNHRMKIKVDTEGVV